MVAKRTVDVSKVGLSTAYAEMNLTDFKAWCEKNGWEGDLEKAYDELLEKAGKPKRKQKDK